MFPRILVGFWMAPALGACASAPPPPPRPHAAIAAPWESRWMIEEEVVTVRAPPATSAPAARKLAESVPRALEAARRRREWEGERSFVTRREVVTLKVVEECSRADDSRSCCTGNYRERWTVTECEQQSALERERERWRYYREALEACIREPGATACVFAPRFGDEFKSRSNECAAECIAGKRGAGAR